MLRYDEFILTPSTITERKKNLDFTFGPVLVKKQGNQFCVTFENFLEHRFLTRGQWIGPMPQWGPCSIKSEVVYHKWHLFKVRLIVQGSVKTVINFRCPSRMKG